MAEFFIIHGDGLYRPGSYLDLYVALSKHVGYNTLTWVSDENGIKAVCRYNHLTSEMIFVIDVVVRKDARNKRTLKELIEKGLETNPNVKYISYERGRKYPERKRRVLNIRDITRR